MPQQCKDNKEEREKLHKICQDYKAKKVMGVSDVKGWSEPSFEPDVPVCKYSWFACNR